MKFFYTFLIIIQLLCMLAAFNHKTKAVCICDKTPPNKCECEKCGCANED